MRTAAIVGLFFVSISLAKAAPFKLLAIGDSLTEEYRFEVPFSAPDLDENFPDSNPGVANTKNWVELLIANRGSSFSMGGYKPSLGGYADYRDAGYEYNYGVPTFKSEKWQQILYDTKLADLSTYFALQDDLDAVQAVLIFIGGNDLSLTNTDAQHAVITQNIGKIHDWVRSNAPANLPIIIATVPDIGATHQEKISDPIIAAAARQRVATLNMNIAALGSRANTYVARIDAITDRIYDQQPFHINGTIFAYPPDRQNRPLHIFCKDGFHPATGSQSLIANEILKAINQFAPTPIPLFSNREILTIIGQNPDQPFLDYTASAGGLLENPDGDALPNLIEYLLATSPNQPDSGFNFLPGGAATFTPSPTAQRYADLTVLQSATLTDDWIPVPPTNLQALPDGSIKILPTAPKLFYKFSATPKP